VRCGLGALPAEVPTLAGVRAAARQRGLQSPRVLDRRFGLDRGFQTYDDRMLAERIGEQGYPERDAAEVTRPRCAGCKAAARAVLPVGPLLRPHSPYVAPGSDAGASAS
jgi:hypothetical protein